jgi:hypothetical protein
MRTAVEFIEENTLIEYIAREEWEDIIDYAKRMDESDKKQLVIDTYINLKMKNNKLPYGMRYLNKLTKVEEDAEQYYNETFKQQKQ